MKKLIGLLVLMVVVTFIPAGFAASPWTTETTYGNKITQKLGFGLKNLVFGPLEILKQPYVGVRDAQGGGEKTKGFFNGLGNGILDGVVYTVGGALHVITFPIPQIDVPLPHDGVQCPFKRVEAVK